MTSGTPRNGFERTVTDVTEALTSAWAGTHFEVGAGRDAVSVRWVDGPGQGQVVMAVRTTGLGIKPIRAYRTLSPGALAGFAADGVNLRDAVHMSAPVPCLLSQAVAGLCAAGSEPTSSAWARARAYALAFAALPEDELEIAVVLARETPDADPRHVAAVARALGAAPRS
jgi:hypothetical protein